MTVFVIDSCGTPLMPTYRLGKVKHLLRSEKAVIVNYDPFTIKLQKKVERPFFQEISIGIDDGYKYVGLCISTKKRELLSAEIRLRADEVIDLLKARRELRSSRRNRKTRYRKARFSNRSGSKKEGWLPPSVIQRIDSLIRDLKRYTKYLPHITKINVETGKFDTQKMNDRFIEGEMYQQGELTGFDNVKAFVRWRDGNICQICHGKSGCKKTEVHHIIPQKLKRIDNPSNLICLCHDCHTALHQGKKKLNTKNLGIKTAKSLASAAAMNVAADRLIEEIRNEFKNSIVKKTYGYITRFNRVKYNIEKSHANDAMVISGNYNAMTSDDYIVIKHIRRHNRQLHKLNFQKNGIRRNNQAERFVKGFALDDYVILDNKMRGFITGRMTSGYATVKTLDGKKLHEKTVVSMKRLRLIRRATSIIYEYRKKT